jgi:hypothetical protein
VRKMIAVVAAAMMLGGGATLAHASAGLAGSHSLYGLCVAYFSGSQTGRLNKHNAPPFKALTATALALTGKSGPLAVLKFCSLLATPGNAPSAHPLGHGPKS